MDTDRRKIAAVLTGIVIALLETGALFVFPLSAGAITKIMIGGAALVAINSMFALRRSRQSVESYFIPLFYFATIFLMHAFLLPLFAREFWNYLEITNLAVIFYAGITTGTLLVIICITNAILKRIHDPNGHRYRNKIPS